MTTETKTIYVHRFAPSGYGPRIFVPYAYVKDLDSILGKLSAWGGADKDTGKAKGYEFSSHDRYALGTAIHAAETLGFNVVDVTAENGHEVWA